MQTIEASRTREEIFKSYELLTKVQKNIYTLNEIYINSQRTQTKWKLFRSNLIKHFLFSCRTARPA